jgi:hypothetical protein
MLAIIFIGPLAQVLRNGECTSASVPFIALWVRPVPLTLARCPVRPLIVNGFCICNGF